MNKTILIIGIICLLVGVSITSSRDIFLKDTQAIYHPLESVDSSKDLLLRGETVYAYCAYDPSGQLNEGFVYFDLEDPGTISNINNISNPGLLSGGTWACNEKFLACDPIMGYLWKIDPYNGDVVFIGGGGIGLNGLTYDTSSIESYVYGCSSTGLYMIDQYSGEQTYIGSFSSGPVNMIGLACNVNGVLFGWDTGTDNLWIIDKETADCELVGSLGIDLNYITDGHFDIFTGTLFLAAYTTKGQLYECDEDTGECYLMYDFQGGAQLTAFVIPFICFNIPPDAPIIISYENGTLFLYSNDPNDDDLKYFIDWDDGTVDETGWYPSGQIVEISHELPDPGVYYVRAKAIDTYDFESPWSVYMIVIGNQPPEAPIIDGPASGKPRTEYEYTFNSIDFNEDPVMFFINWGDNNTEWTEYGDSGDEISLKHTWYEKGNYTIKAKAKDFLGYESDWSEFTVTMPRDKAISTSTLLRFLERYPKLNLLLQRLTNL